MRNVHVMLALLGLVAGMCAVCSGKPLTRRELSARDRVRKSCEGQSSNGPVAAAIDAVIQNLKQQAQALQASGTAGSSELLDSVKELQNAKTLCENEARKVVNKVASNAGRITSGSGSGSGGGSGGGSGVSVDLTGVLNKLFDKILGDDKGESPSPESDTSDPSGGTENGDLGDNGPSDGGDYGGGYDYDGGYDGGDYDGGYDGGDYDGGYYGGDYDGGYEGGGYYYR